MGEVGDENASCGWVMDLSCDLSSAISARSFAISRWVSKPPLSIFVWEDLGWDEGGWGGDGSLDVGWGVLSCVWLRK